MIRIFLSHFVLSIIGILTIFLQWLGIGDITQMILGIIETIFASIFYVKIGRNLQYEYNKGLKTSLRIFSISLIIVFVEIIDTIFNGGIGGRYLSPFLNLPFMPLFALFQGILNFKYEIFLLMLLGLLPSTLIFVGYYSKNEHTGTVRDH